MLVIELGPGRLQGGEWRSGTLSPLHAVTFAPGDWEGAWSARLAPLDAPLRSIIAAIGHARLPVTVLHHSPTCVADVFSCPSRGRAARDAALLALADHAGFPLEDHPHDTVLLANDHAGSPRQSHLLLTAEHDDTSSAIVEWLGRSGLHAQSIIPIAATHLRSAVDQTMAEAKSGAKVLLRIGEHTAHLTAAVGGQLKLVRQVSLDIQTLVEALTAPISVRIPGGSAAVATEITLSRDEARAALFHAGIPERDKMFEPERGITGGSVLPALQPVLQRALVEVRQALRFGLDDPERTTAQFLVIGPGAAIPRLGEVLAAQLCLAHALPTAQIEFRSDLEDALRQLPRVDVNLLPRTAATQAGFRRFRIALIAGCTAAFVTGGIDTALTLQQIRDADQATCTLKASAEQAQKFLEARAAVAGRTAAINGVVLAAADACGQTPDWAAWLRELALITPPDVRLLDINMLADGQTPRCELRGVASAESGSSDVSAYVQKLQASPLVSRVALGATQRGSSGASAEGSVDFQLTVSLVAVPPRFTEDTETAQ